MIYPEYKCYISRLVFARYLVVPHIGHVCVILPLVMPHVRHAHLGLHIGVRLKGRTTHIWSFGCTFTYGTIMEYAGLELSFGIIIVI